MIPIEGHTNLFRDEQTGAIVNCDTLEYEKYFKMKNKKNEEKKEIENIKNEISEIKTLLKELINDTRRNNA